MFPNWKAADFNHDEVLNVFDLCLMKRVLIESVLEKHNILQDSDRWWGHVLDGAGEVIPNKNTSSVTASVTKTSAENWQIESQIFDLPLKKNTSYLLSFDASCTKNTEIEINLVRDTKDYPRYFTGYAALASSKKHFSYVIEDLPESFDDYYISIEYGADTGTYSISKLTLSEIS